VLEEVGCREDGMTNKAIDPTRLDDSAATVGFSVKEANKAKV
jgi:hypothetical protein